MKKNCWEHKNCGRQPGGANEAELGTCPAFRETVTDGVNSGTKGGRCCWAIAGTLCGNTVQGTFAAKLSNCMKCDFYKRVMEEEGPDYVRSKEILALIEKKS